MNRFPLPIENLIKEFSQLPSVGRKTAEKYVFYLLKQKKDNLQSFAQALTELQSNLKICPECGNFSQQQETCGICSNPQRDRQTLCVVEESHDLNVIEATGQYNGLYHVLGGTLNPIEGITAEHLNVKNLTAKITKENVTEVILALNPDIAGEATMVYLKNLLQPLNIKISRLAKGLPMGSDLEYADEVTLTHALKGRKQV